MTEPDLNPLFEATEDQPPAVAREMVMMLGPVAHRLVLERFAQGSDSPWALEMHRRLLAGERRRQGFADLWVVEAPPVGWSVLARWCRVESSRSAFPASGETKGEMRTLSRLGFRIATELGRLSKHPAYHDEATLGLDPVVLPAFRYSVPEPEPHLAPPRPTPEQAADAAGHRGTESWAGAMMPYAVQVHGEVMTVWRWQRDDD